MFLFVCLFFDFLKLINHNSILYRFFLCPGETFLGKSESCQLAPSKYFLHVGWCSPMNHWCRLVILVTRVPQEVPEVLVGGRVSLELAFPVPGTAVGTAPCHRPTVMSVFSPGQVPHCISVLGMSKWEDFSESWSLSVRPSGSPCDSFHGQNDCVTVNIIVTLPQVLLTCMFRWGKGSGSWLENKYLGIDAVDENKLLFV